MRAALHRPALALALAGVFGPGSAAAQAQVFDLDPTQSWVQFEVRHFDTSTLRGRFGPLRGEVEIDLVARRGPAFPPGYCFSGHPAVSQPRPS